MGRVGATSSLSRSPQRTLAPGRLVLSRANPSPPLSVASKARLNRISTVFLCLSILFVSWSPFLALHFSSILSSALFHLVVASPSLAPSTSAVVYLSLGEGQSWSCQPRQALPPVFRSRRHLRCLSESELRNLRSRQSARSHKISRVAAPEPRHTCARPSVVFLSSLILYFGLPLSSHSLPRSPARLDRPPPPPP